MSCISKPHTTHNGCRQQMLQSAARMQQMLHVLGFLLAVSITLVPTTNAQETYLFSIPRRHELLAESDANFRKNNISEFYNSIDKRLNEQPNILQKDLNTTIILFKNSRPKEPEPDFSQTAMDIITIVWYVATFLALAAFFLLMACSEKRCNDSAQANTNGNDIPQPPPTPSPSYSEFAPPSYETVMKMQHAAKPSIFVIAFPANADELDGNKEASNDSSQQLATTPATPIINYYTIDELQKLGSSS